MKVEGCNNGNRDCVARPKHNKGREKRCKMYTGQSSNVPLNDWTDLKRVFRSGNFTPHQAVDYKWEHLRE